MQASDHYFTTQMSIFLLLYNLTDIFSSALGNSFFRLSLWLHTSEKTVGMFNWRNYILGEISLLHYNLMSVAFEIKVRKFLTTFANFCRNPPRSAVKTQSENLLFFFSFQKQPDIKYQKRFYLIKCGIVSWASAQC